VQVMIVKIIEFLGVHKYYVNAHFDEQ